MEIKNGRSFRLFHNDRWLGRLLKIADPRLDAKASSLLHKMFVSLDAFISRALVLRRDAEDRIVNEGVGYPVFRICTESAQDSLDQGLELPLLRTLVALFDQ
jgi:hypothetical protein